MRNMFLVTASVFVLSACSSTPTPPSLDGSSQHDLASPGGPQDLAVATKTGCSGEAACFGACADQTCVTQCANNTTAQGKAIFNKALGCGQSWCLALNDMGSGDCKLDTTMTMLTDNHGMGSCNNCLNDALAGLFSSTCANPSGPNCNPAACTPIYTQCANSLP